MNTQQFIDESIFNGILDFDCDYGKIRAIKDSTTKTAQIFLLSENSWIFECHIQYSGKFTCKNIFKAFKGVQQ